MQDKARVIEQIKKEAEKEAAQKASTKVKSARWDLDVAIFLCVVLILVIVLLFQGIDIEIVAPVAIFGLACVWLVGWQRGKKLYRIFYKEELIELERKLTEWAKQKEKAQKMIEVTMDEHVKRALRERWGETSIAN